MQTQRTIRLHATSSHRDPSRCAPAISAALLLLAATPLLVQPSAAQTTATQNPMQAAAQPAVLDSVIAVVNHQVILSSDLDLELRMMRLLPAEAPKGPEVSQALDQLTTRALIEQQILLEDPHGLEIDPAQLNRNLAELRQSLPACRNRDCVSAPGWQTYLATLGLSSAEVDRYWARRMAVLAFIERRFRSGIRIPSEEIEKYYRETLVPHYSSPATAPSLEKLSPRIQDLLLEKRVDVLLDDWLKTLQSQGEVEILDPALASSQKVADDKTSDGQKGEEP